MRDPRLLLWRKRRSIRLEHGVSKSQQKTTHVQQGSWRESSERIYRENRGYIKGTNGMLRHPRTKSLNIQT